MSPRSGTWPPSSTGWAPSILGAGSSTITVEGVGPEDLGGVEHTVVPDRIEAATYLAALAVAGGEITLAGARLDHMDMFAQKLGDMGVRVSPDPDGIWAMAPEPAAVGRRRHPAVPGRGHRLQAAARRRCWRSPTASASSPRTSSGAGSATSTSSSAWAPTSAPTSTTPSSGAVERLSGAPVRAPDIRAGAALVVAGLRADGETVVHDAHHIDRGYEDFAGRLRSLGADVVDASDVGRSSARSLSSVGSLVVLLLLSSCSASLAARLFATKSRKANSPIGSRTSRISSQPPWWASSTAPHHPPGSTRTPTTAETTRAATNGVADRAAARSDRWRSRERSCTTTTAATWPTARAITPITASRLVREEQRSRGASRSSRARSTPVRRGQTAGRRSCCSGHEHADVVGDRVGGDDRHECRHVGGRGLGATSSPVTRADHQAAPYQHGGDDADEEHEPCRRDERPRPARARADDVDRATSSCC